MTAGNWISVIGLFVSIMAISVGIITRKIEKGERQREKREESRVKRDVMMTELLFASISLGEATATAIQNGHANGEMKGALKYSKEKKFKFRDFLQEQGISNTM